MEEISWRRKALKNSLRPKQDRQVEQGANHYDETPEKRTAGAPRTIIVAQGDSSDAKAGIVALDSYTSKKYSGPATLFRATVQLDGFESHRNLGWDEFIDGDLEIYDTPGHHGSIVRDPRAKVLAAQLKESLQKAQASVREARSKPAMEMDSAADFTVKRETSGNLVSAS